MKTCKQTTKKIATLKKLIATQERTLVNLTAVECVIDNGATIALTEKILSNLRVALRLLRGQV